MLALAHVDGDAVVVKLDLLRIPLDCGGRKVGGESSLSLVLPVLRAALRALGNALICERVCGLV